MWMPDSDSRSGQSPQRSARSSSSTRPSRHLHLIRFSSERESGYSPASGWTFSRVAHEAWPALVGFGFGFVFGFAVSFQALS